MAEPIKDLMRGIVFTGNGNCSRFWTPELCAELTPVLGYTPVPGSLNLVLLATLPLGTPHGFFWDSRRPKGGKQGGTYQFWRARFGIGEYATSAHIMKPDVRGHGPNCIELVAPFRIRERWQVKNGDRLWILPRK